MEACITEIPRFHRGDLELISQLEVDLLAKTAKALSDPIRLQMLYLLGQRGDLGACGEDLCTCEFEELLGLSQSKVSYHLNLLLQAGLITREARGTWSHYRLTNPNVLDLTRLLAGGGQEQAGGLSLYRPTN